MALPWITGLGIQAAGGGEQGTTGPGIPTPWQTQAHPLPWCEMRLSGGLFSCLHTHLQGPRSNLLPHEPVNSKVRN